MCMRNSTACVFIRLHFTSCAHPISVTCPFGDQIYHEGDVWVDNPVYPCKWFTCRRTGVQQVNTTFCPPLLPRDCPRERQPGQCCYTCQTPGRGLDGDQ